MPGGIYIRTSEIREKNRQSMLKRYENDKTLIPRIVAAKKEYNRTHENPQKGVPRSEKTKLLISQKNKGKKHKPETIERPRILNGGEKNRFYGKHHTEDAKAKIGKANKGRLKSEETLRKLSTAGKGRTITEEQRKKLSEARKGKCAGESAPWWNPNREEVRLNGQIARIMARLLERCRVNKTDRTYIMLGYTNKEFKQDIESKFYRHPVYGDMTWKLQGLGRGTWQIHHIKSVVSYAREGITDPRVINALSNLQPLWWDDHNKTKRYNEDNKWR